MTYVYNEDDETKWYLVKYGLYFTSIELKHLGVLRTLEYGPPTLIQREDVQSYISKVKTEEGFQERLAMGYDRFLTITVSRIRRDNPGIPLVKRCSHCDAVLRTSVAKQCIRCGASWKAIDVKS